MSTTTEIDGLVARTVPQPRADVDNGTHHNEWRCDRVRSSDLPEYLWSDFHHKGPWCLQRRHVRTENDVETIVGEWQVMGFGPTKADAMQTGWETSFLEAVSHDPIHVQLVAFWRQHRADSDRTYDALKRAEAAFAGVNEAANADYHAELKRARIHSLAMHGKAPADKVAAIKSRLVTKWTERRNVLELELREANHAYATVKARKFQPIA